MVMSSLAGFETRMPEIARPYTTFKAAQAMLSKDYSRKLSPLNVRINTVVPGFIGNPNIERPDGTVELSTFNAIAEANPGFIEGGLKMVPLGRVGKPEEIAMTVLFLSSPLASYITGARLMIDGGMSVAV